MAFRFPFRIATVRGLAAWCLNVLLLALCIGWVTACSAQETSPAAARESDSAASAQSADATPARGEVPAAGADLSFSEVDALVVWTTPAQVAPLTALGLEFERTVGIPVRVEAHELSTMLDDFKQALSLQTDMPDIFLGGHDWVGLLAANGVVAPLNLEHHQAEFAPAVLRAMSYAGQQFGVPVKVESLALLVNSRLVAEPPQTWRQVREIAGAQVHETGIPAGLGLDMLSPIDFYPVLTALGGDLFPYAPETGFDVTDVHLDSESSLQALAWLREMQADGLISLELSRGELQQAFVEQRLPLWITGPWSLPALAAADIEFAVSDFPDGGRPFVNVQGYMVNAYAPDPFLAWFFLSSQVMTEDGMARILAADPAPPAFLPLLRHDVLPPHLREFSRVAQRGAEAPTLLQMSEIWKIWGQAHYDVVANGADGPASYRAAAEKIRDLLSGNRAMQP